MNVTTTKEIKDLARRMAALGQREDKILAHLTPSEAAMLSRVFGGDVNPHTGLPQFGLFSGLLNSVGGLLGIGGNSSSNAGQTAYNEINAQTAPLFSAAQGELNQYKSGQLTSGDQASLDAATNSAQAANNQYFAGSGLGNSTMNANANAALQYNTLTSKQNMLNGYLSAANQLYGTAFAPYQSAVQDQLQGNEAAQTTTANALGAIFGNSGVQSGLGSLFSSATSGLGSLFNSDPNSSFSNVDPSNTIDT